MNLLPESLDFTWLSFLIFILRGCLSFAHGLISLVTDKVLLPFVHGRDADAYALYIFTRGSTPVTEREQLHRQVRLLRRGHGGTVGVEADRIAGDAEHQLPGQLPGLAAERQVHVFPENPEATFRISGRPSGRRV